MKCYVLFLSVRYDKNTSRKGGNEGEMGMKGKWSEYKFREDVKVMERYLNLVVYRYFDIFFREQRYVIVVEDLIMLNTREYPCSEIYSFADIYQEILTNRKAG